MKKMLRSVATGVCVYNYTEDFGPKLMASNPGMWEIVEVDDKGEESMPVTKKAPRKRKPKQAAAPIDPAPGLHDLFADSDGGNDGDNL